MSVSVYSFRVVFKNLTTSEKANVMVTSNNADNAAGAGWEKLSEVYPDTPKAELFKTFYILSINAE